MCGLHQILKPAISFRVGEAHLRPLKGRGNPLDCHVFFLYTIVFLGNLGTYFRDRFNPPKHNGWIFLHRDGGLKVFPCFFWGGEWCWFSGVHYKHILLWHEVIPYMYALTDHESCQMIDYWKKKPSNSSINSPSLLVLFFCGLPCRKRLFSHEQCGFEASTKHLYHQFLE